jgi:hypothetical protein
MAITYKCPRCEGTEIYFANRQRITGAGGIYGNRAKMVKTALCKQCGENADLIRDEKETRKYRAAIVAAIAGITFTVFLVILFIIDITSGL